MSYFAQALKVNRTLIALAGLVLATSCSPSRDEPRRGLKDAMTGELPIVALCGAASDPLLAVWPNGDAVWKDGLVRSGDMKSGALSAADLDSLIADLDGSLAGYEDTTEEFATARGPFVRLAYQIDGKTRWFTTLHTLPDEQRTVVNSRRASEYVGTDPSVRTRYAASIPAVDRAFEAAWDDEIVSLTKRLSSVQEPSHLRRRAVGTDWR